MMNNPPEFDPPYLELTPYLRCTPRTVESEGKNGLHSRHSIHNCFRSREGGFVLRESPRVELTGNAFNQVVLLARLRNGHAALVVQATDYVFETFNDVGSYVRLHRLSKINNPR